MHKVMKIYRYIIVFFFVVGGLSSCNDWLDINADTKVVQEELFESYEGFRSSLNGIYRLLGTKELYARNLTWGAASVLGNNYEKNTLPYSYRDFLNDYEAVSGKKYVEEIWEQGYKLISNCNNLLIQGRDKKDDFFPEGKVEKDVIMGEAIGMRALLHFDLLRLYAPSFKEDDGKLYIPYVTVYPEHQPKHLSVTAVMDSIISDLKRARDMLSYNDTLYNVEAIHNVKVRFHTVFASVKGGFFFSNRGGRMNYFAATALLARAYLYKGDKINAYRYAHEVYQYSTRKTYFQFTPASAFELWDKNGWPQKMYDDILMAAYNEKMYDIYKDELNSQSTEINFFLKNIDDLYRSDANDFRKTKLISGSWDDWEEVWTYLSTRWSKPADLTYSEAQDVATYQGPIAPVIRMSEVYYIMCECLAEEGKVDEATDLLQTVRTARGAINPLPLGMTKDDFLTILRKEMVKDFMTEGQTFFLYKRLDEPVYDGSSGIDMTGKWVLPAPYSETAYTNL